MTKTIIMENDMRLIISDELLADEKYLELSKNEFDRVLRIVSLFANEDKEELSINYLMAKFDISEEFKEKTSFIFYFGKVVKIKQYFNWFKGNKSAVAKARTKPATQSSMPEIENEVVNEVILKEEQLLKENDIKAIDKKHNIDYDKVKDIYNETFKNTTVPQIRLLTDARKKNMKKLFDIMSIQLATKVTIYEFYESYFDLIKGIGDRKMNLVKGWLNTKSNSHFQPDLDYFIKDKVFVSLIEKSNEE